MRRDSGVPRLFQRRVGLFGARACALVRFCGLTPLRSLTLADSTQLTPSNEARSLREFLPFRTNSPKISAVRNINRL